ncbi:MAG TPA: response regulator [Candidatus Binatia bacterium]|jgi:DNA-binding response OmpR family regulator|nr:response regulator [Candidatus Binatia bacterium]
MSPVCYEGEPPPTILVADDNPDMMGILTRFLSKAGMVALPAYDGRQCLEQVSRGAIDVIVVDMMMSGMDSLEVCAALKKMATACSIPIILLTAKDDLDTHLAAMRLGVSEFLLKPVRGWDLLARIRVHVEFNRKAREMDRALHSLQEAGA